MFVPAARSSQFSKSLVKVRYDFVSHVKFLMGNGSSVRFWLDWWSGDDPMAVSFPVCFSYCYNPHISISGLAANNWDMGLRHSLSPEELGQWKQLATLCPTFSEEGDIVVYPHVASGRFSVKYLYSRHISGVVSARFSAIWRARVPLRIKIFLWQAICPGQAPGY